MRPKNELKFQIGLNQLPQGKLRIKKRPTLNKVAIKKHPEVFNKKVFLKVS